MNGLSEKAATVMTGRSTPSSRQPQVLGARSNAADATGPLEKALPGSKAYIVDLTSPDAVRSTFAGIRRDLGPVDILLVQQDRSAWTFELDLRTSTEKW